MSNLEQIQQPKPNKRDWNEQYWGWRFTIAWANTCLHHPFICVSIQEPNQRRYEDICHNMMNSFNKEMIIDTWFRENDYFFIGRLHPLWKVFDIVVALCQLLASLLSILCTSIAWLLQASLHQTHSWVHHVLSRILQVLISDPFLGVQTSSHICMNRSRNTFISLTTYKALGAILSKPIYSYSMGIYFFHQ